MTQELEGIDIYHCPYFNVDSSGDLKFARGAYYNRAPDSFKNITEIYNILRYCMWVVKQKEHLPISKYAAIVYMTRVNKRLEKITMEYKKVLKGEQRKQEKNLKNSIDKPGRTYV